jgi:hypothetical protein
LSNPAQIARRIEQAFERKFQELAVYPVEAGDNLTKIIRSYYGIASSDLRFDMAMAHVLYFNPEIKDPNKIYVGQLLRLPPVDENEDPKPYCEVKQEFTPNYTAQYSPAVARAVGVGGLTQIAQSIPKDPQEREMFRALAWLHQNYDYLSIATGTGFNTWGNLVSDANRALILQVEVLYRDYKAGLISQNQYNYRRQLALKQFAERLGPFEKFLLKGKTAREAIRISRSKAIPATAKINFHATRLANMAQYAKHGGILLTAAGVGMGCYNISQTESRAKKNEIFCGDFGGIDSRYHGRHERWCFADF